MPDERGDRAPLLLDADALRGLRSELCVPCHSIKVSNQHSKGKAESLNSVTNSNVTDIDGVDVWIELYMNKFLNELIRRIKVIPSATIYLFIFQFETPRRQYLRCDVRIRDRV